jgi:hypothetical protein
LIDACPSPAFLCLLNILRFCGDSLCSPEFDLREILHYFELTPINKFISLVKFSSGNDEIMMGDHPMMKDSKDKWING